MMRPLNWLLYGDGGREIRGMKCPECGEEMEGNSAVIETETMSAKVWVWICPKCHWREANI